MYLPEQVGEPWRLAEGALRDWKIPVALKKDGVSVGNITLTIAVYDHMVALTPLPRLRGRVRGRFRRGNPTAPNPNPSPNPNQVALLKPAGEARAEPNQNPQLPEPLRRMPWDEAPLATSSLGCCGGQAAGGGNMAA